MHIVDIKEEGVGDVLGRWDVRDKEELVWLRLEVLGMTFTKVLGIIFSDI